MKAAANMIKDKITFWRKKKRMSQRELADALYVSRSLVTRWEQGTRYPTKDMLKKLAELFSVSYEELAGDEIEAIESQEELAECVPAEINNDSNSGLEEERNLVASEDMMIRIMAKKVSDLLRSFTKTERLVFMRRYYYYDSIGEIAKAVNMSEEEVSALLRELRNKMMYSFDEKD